MRNYALLRQPALTFLAIGAVTGLILGLLIGWVFWPVQWQGASLRDLYPADKAEYIAAVADAFVIYDSPEAAEVAQRRLATIDDGNLDQAFQEALSYFSASTYSDKAIRDSNIRRLAVALNMAPPTMADAPQALTTTATEGLTTPISAPIPVAEEATEGLGWMGWLLWFLTAVVLLVGGMYILRKAGLPDLQTLRKARTQPPHEIDEFEEPPARAQRSSQRAKLIAPHKPSATDYSFEQEEDDEWPPVGDERTRRSISNTYNADDDFGKDDYADDNYTDDPYTDEEFVEEEEHDLPFDEDDDAEWRPPGKSYTIDVTKEENPLTAAKPAIYTASDPTTEVRASTHEADVAGDIPPTEDQSPKAAIATAVAPRVNNSPVRGANANRVERPTITRARTKVIDQHVFHYQMGMMEYDESRPIVDPQSGKYIGEFGMGASDKNALIQTGPHQLVALEVWIFDKSDERNLGNQTRILLSEYAIDHNLEQMFLKERQDNPRPFTAQPGVHFQLESQNLLLDCTIVDVVYSSSNATKGIFQEITVDMSVQQKG